MHRVNFDSHFCLYRLMSTIGAYYNVASRCHCCATNKLEQFRRPQRGNVIMHNYVFVMILFNYLVIPFVLLLA